MLRGLVITSGSGLVLFEKEWTRNFKEPAKWGGFIRTLQEFSIQCVGYPVSYMEYPDVQFQVGISASLLIFDDGTEAIAEGELDDKLSVLANFQALHAIADLTLGMKKEELKLMSIDMPKKHVIVHRVGDVASLVNICKSEVPRNLYIPNIENTVILLEENFGLSNIIRDGEFLKTSCGSPNYAAPEVIDGKYYSGEEVDVWSTGVILYALLTARLPFDDDYIPNLFNKIKKGKFKMPLLLSSSCRNLISEMLKVDPLSRVTIPGIKVHPWFLQNLPDYLRDFDDAEENGILDKKLDEEILQDLQKLYLIPMDKILSELRKETSPDSLRANPYVVSYFLLHDNKYENCTINTPQTNSSQKTKKIRIEDSKANQIDNLLNQEPQPPLAVINLREVPFSDGFVQISTHVSPNYIYTLASENSCWQLGSGVHSKVKPLWYLGVLSQKHPNDIMYEVFRALIKLGFEWKVISPYQLHVRVKQDSKNINSEYPNTIETAIESIKKPSTESIKKPSVILSQATATIDVDKTVNQGIDFSNIKKKDSIENEQAATCGDINCPKKRDDLLEDSLPLYINSEDQAASVPTNFGPSDKSKMYENTGDSSEFRSENPVRIAVQLFKASSEGQPYVYFLDVKKLLGHPLTFFDLCGIFLQELSL